MVLILQQCNKAQLANNPSNQKILTHNALIGSKEIGWGKEKKYTNNGE